MVDWTKPIQTKDGRRARVLCKDRATIGDDCVVVLVKNKDQLETPHCVTDSGFGGLFTIINVPEQVEKYVNVYANDPHGLAIASHDTLQKAEKYAGPGRTQRIMLVFVGGRFAGAEVVDVDQD